MDNKQFHPDQTEKIEEVNVEISKISGKETDVPLYEIIQKNS